MSAPSATTLVVTPQDFFVGDLVCVQYVFPGERVLLAAENFTTGAVAADSAVLKKMETEFCTITDASLSLSGSQYTAVVFFIPWKPGAITLPRINFGSENQPFYVQLPTIQVASLLENLENKELRPPAAPLLIPGTTYIVYGAVIIIILLFSLLCLLVIKFSAIKKWFLYKTVRRKFRRNYRSFIKKIKKLEKKGTKNTPGIFTTEICRLLREYFEGRFLENFSAAVTAEIDLMLETAGVEQKLIELTVRLFSRCDCIRFSSPENAILDTGARNQLSNQARFIARECENAPF